MIMLTGSFILMLNPMRYIGCMDIGYTNAALTKKIFLRFSSNLT